MVALVKVGQWTSREVRHAGLPLGFDVRGER